MVFFLKRLIIIIKDHILGNHVTVERWRIGYSIVRIAEVRNGKQDEFYKVLVLSGDLFINQKYLSALPSDPNGATWKDLDYAEYHADRYIRTGLHPDVMKEKTNDEVLVDSIMKS